MITKKEVEHIAILASEMMQKFLQHHRLDADVIVVVAPEWDQANIVCASTAPPDETVEILNVYTRREDTEE